MSLSAAVVAVGRIDRLHFRRGASAAGGTLNGAGSTLVAPLEAEWASAFGAKTGNTVNYNPVGSGTGITRHLGRHRRLRRLRRPAEPHSGRRLPQLHPDPVGSVGHGRRLQRPGRRPQAEAHRAAAGGHLPGSDHHLERPGGSRGLNKGVHLPNLKITPVFRTDGSGDTYAFTNYLTHRSAARGRPRSASAPRSASRPASAGKGNSGVTAVLEATPGSIAYIAVST